MKLAQSAYLGRDLTPYANCICLNISSWFGKVRVAHARRDVTKSCKHTAIVSYADPEGRNCKNDCEVLAEFGLEAKPRPPSPLHAQHTMHAPASASASLHASASRHSAASASGSSDGGGHSKAYRGFTLKTPIWELYISADWSVMCYPLGL